MAPSGTRETRKKQKKREAAAYRCVNARLPLTAGLLKNDKRRV